jgi:polar amino acid transport system substrate-binding protein
MNRPILLLIFFSSILFSTPVVAENKTISICSFEWPPHHSATVKNGGYTAELIQAIFKPKGYKIKKKFLPWKRAQVWAAEGKECDAITEIYLNTERLEIFWYGAPYSIHEVYVIALKSHPVKAYNRLQDLAGLTFGHNSGASLSKEFDSAVYITKFETKGYNVGIRMLLAKRFDFYVSARSVAFHEAQKIGQVNKIHAIGEPLKRQLVYMAFSMVNSKNIERMQDYNQGLYLIQRNGTYASIMKKHGFN